MARGVVVPPEGRAQRQRKEEQHDQRGDPSRLGEHLLHLAHGSHEETRTAQADEIAQSIEDGKEGDAVGQPEEASGHDGEDAAHEEAADEALDARLPAQRRGLPHVPDDAPLLRIISAQMSAQFVHWQDLERKKSIAKALVDLHRQRREIRPITDFLEPWNNPAEPVDENSAVK